MRSSRAAFTREAIASPSESSQTTISSDLKSCASALASASEKKRSLYAGIRIETRGDTSSARRRPRRDHLVEDLVLLDHAEVEARVLLDRLEALLQVADLGVHRVVARLQFRVRVALLRERPVELPDPRPASLAEPQRILQREEQAGEDPGEDLQARACSW